LDPQFALWTNTKIWNWNSIQCWNCRIKKRAGRLFNIPFIYSFFPAFPLVMVAGVAALGGLEIPHGQQQSQIVLSGFTPQHGTKQNGDLFTPPGSWTTSGPLSHERSQQDMPRQFFVWYSGTRSTKVAGISRFGGEVAQRSGLSEFHSCAPFREVSQRKLFAKIHFSRFHLR